MATDSANLSRIRSGDRGGFNELFTKYKESLYQYLCLLNRGDQAINRLFAELFFDTIRQAGSQAPRRHFNRWFFKKAHEASQRFEAHIPPEPDPALERLNRLSAVSREIVFLRHQLKLPWNEIDAITGESPAEGQRHFAEALLDLAPPKALPKGNRAACLPIRRLAVDQLEKSLKPKEADKFRSHLTQCQACSVEYGLMQREVNELDSANWPLPPATTLLPVLDQATPLIEQLKKTPLPKNIFKWVLGLMLLMGLGWGGSKLAAKYLKKSSKTVAEKTEKSKSEKKRRTEARHRTRNDEQAHQREEKKIGAVIKKENYIFPEGNFADLDKKRDPLAAKAESDGSESDPSDKSEKSGMSDNSDPSDRADPSDKSDQAQAPEKTDVALNEGDSAAAKEPDADEISENADEPKPEESEKIEEPKAKKNRVALPLPKSKPKQRFKVPPVIREDFETVKCGGDDPTDRSDQTDRSDHLLELLAKLGDKNPQGSTLDPTTLVRVSASYLEEQAPGISERLGQSGESDKQGNSFFGSRSSDSRAWVRVKAGQGLGQPEPEAAVAENGSALGESPEEDVPCSYVRLQTPDGKSVLLEIHQAPLSEINPLSTHELACCPMPPSE